MTPMQRQTTAAGSVGGGRQRLVIGRVADHLDRDGRPGHPGQHVPRRQAEVDDDGPCLDGRLAAVLAARHDGRAPVRRRRPRSGPAAGPTVTTGSGRATPAARSRSAARAVRSPARSLPGQTGWISAAPVATTISSASTWSTPDGVRATTVGPGVDADDLDAVARVEDQRVRASARGQAARRTAADDDASRPTRRSTGTSGRTASSGSGGFPSAGCRATTAPGRAGRLARPDEGDAVDDREAVPAVAGEAQRPAASRVLAGAEDRDRERVARAGLDRPAVDDEPDRRSPPGASVTGASARPGGRTAARAGAAPAAAGR